MQVTDFQWTRLWELIHIGEFIEVRFFPIRWEIWPILLRASMVTLAMAFLGTLLAILIAIPLSFMAAKNTSIRLIRNPVKIILNFLRSVPEIVFGLILVVVLGLGTFPAVVAIILHNIGVLGKLIAELIEASDKGPQEAMRSVGATWTIGNMIAILPQIWPNLLSQYFYRFEVAIRTSLILGFIGGGGLGQQLFNHFNSMNYQAVALDILFIMALVMLVDSLGSYVRSRVI
ncbi:phosphonate ABC transporter, permease protein PhnE [Salisediminibacterium beveridgei]|uniref:Phosphonate/phosphite ABC transporter membrane channel protein n=1 Tax=Salisediminibacterium beveridgei TaxID=632773 RepID=A0A1D7QZ91_9BACI|nr:phosphonate ABC transporter, permease protein PhnE [Salisediminibacterium beveridgei]AOM84313.1 Phosphonate/phosphite ABC transporter membrane channel protein [Salisediminibacterium beveridgei]